jgi:arylsulfatase A-like enzyme
MKEKDATIAALLKTQGYATGQFGKNHLGDLDEHLPTNHGFDEFFGNLYHLNAEEEPENEDYPADLVMADGRTFHEVHGPRGVLKSKAVYDEKWRCHRSEDRRHRATHQESAWKPSMTRPWPPRSSTSGPGKRTAPHGSSGGTARVCTFRPTSAKSAGHGRQGCRQTRRRVRRRDDRA